MSGPRPWSHARVALLAGAWCLLAAMAAASGLLALRPWPAVPITLWSLVALLLAAWWRVPGFGAWLGSVGLRLLAAIHLTRFVGIYFLVLHARGELPTAFAVPGGWGDIAVAAAALVLLPLAPDRGAGTRRLYLAWNVAGLADILFVVATAARLAYADPGSMAPLTRFPLGLLPTFLVPIIIVSHAVMIARLARRAP